MKTVSRKLLVTAMIAAMGSTAANAASVEDLDRRLMDLEAAVEANREETRDVANSATKGLGVSGYSTLEYVVTNQDTKYSGFRLRHFNLMFKKQINPDFKFFSSVMLEDAPLLDKNTSTNGTGGKLLVEAVSFNYTLSPSTTIRAGRFFTPAGIWSLDSIPFVLTQDRPLHIRNIFPHVIDGVTVGGMHEMGSAYVNYDVYLGNGQTNQFDGSSDYNANKGVGGKINFALPFADRFEFGGTAYSERMKTTSTAAEEDKNAYGVHFQARQGGFYIRGEYAKGKYAPIGVTAGDYNRVGYYIQPSYDMGQTSLGYRYDYYDAKTKTAASSATVENVPFIAYHVDKNTTLKWEHHLVDLRDPAKKDFYRSIVSIAVNLE